MSITTNLSRRKLFLGVILSAFFALQIFAQNAPPKAEVRNVMDEYFGVKTVDPYRWMEDLKSDEMQKWMRGQADYADTYLKKLPLRDELIKRQYEVSTAGTKVRSVRRIGERYFYFKAESGDPAEKLYVRDGLNGAERVLLDTNKLFENDKQAAVTGYSPSPDGKMVAYLLALGGGEFGAMHFIDVATGKETGDLIKDTAWNVENELNWTPDSRAFSYFRFNLQNPSERYAKTLILLHTLGTKPEADIPLFGYGINPNIQLVSESFPNIFFQVETKYAVAEINPDPSGKSDFYIVPLLSLKESPIPWRKIVSVNDDVKAVAEHGDYLYLVTYKNSPRYKITRINLKKPDVINAETVFPASEAVVQNMSVAKDALYVGTLDGGTERLFRVDYKTLKTSEVKSPFAAASVSVTDASPEREGVLFTAASWTSSPAVFDYNPKTNRAADTKLIPPSPIDLSPFEATNTRAKSYDGTMIPLVILHKKGLKLDGTNPTILGGYGAYGVVILSSYPAAEFVPWMERGGVIAIAGVRGGGEFGEEWHLAGKEKTKPNTWKDFIACAEYLIEKKYTSSAHLAITSRSAGGILISNAIAERPELFAAAVIGVGINNPLRHESTPNPNVYEFGSIKTEEGFRSLLAMDGYLKIKDGVKYPAVLLTQGINDPRVVPWMSAKMAARLQAASTGGKPVLLRLDYEAGHGFGSSPKQRIEDSAESSAFLFEQLGTKK